MSQVDTASPTGAPAKRGFSGKQVLLFLLIAMILTAGLTFWLIRTYVYAKDFKPVELSAREQVQLDQKLSALGLNPKELLPAAKRPAGEDQFDSDGRLVPERYEETDANRQIDLSERELNAMLASNADLARRFAVDLSENLASAKLLIPVDPDMPMFGGKTLRVNAGLELDYRNAQPVVVLRGVSVMGVPIPNAWLGNLKNVDLVEQFGGDPGFWRSFAGGVELMEINDGNLRIQLKE
ncbi:MAG: arginine N-succinyltransferase [Pseudomonadota bacterium]